MIGDDLDCLLFRDAARLPGGDSRWSSTKAIALPISSIFPLLGRDAAKQRKNGCIGGASL
jgi:hypothetical protein